MTDADRISASAAIWNKMKNYIEIHYPDLPSGKQYSYEQLRDIVKEAWDSITSETLQELLESMPARCKAVVEANGGHTKY